MNKKQKEILLVLFGIIISAIFIYWMKPLIFCTINWASEISENSQNIGGVVFTVSVIILMIWIACFYWKKVIEYIKREYDYNQIVLENIKIQKRIKIYSSNRYNNYKPHEDTDEDYYRLNSYMVSKNKYEGTNLCMANQEEAYNKIYQDTSLKYLLEKYGPKKYKRKTAKINFFSKYYSSRIYYKVIGEYFDEYYNKYVEINFNIYDFIDLELDKYIDNNNITSVSIPYTKNIFSSNNNFNDTGLKYKAIKYMVENMSNVQILKKCICSNMLVISLIFALGILGIMFFGMSAWLSILGICALFSVPSLIRCIYRYMRLVKIKFDK